MFKIFFFSFPSDDYDKIIYFCEYEAVVSAVQFKFPCIFNTFLSTHETKLHYDNRNAF